MTIRIIDDEIGIRKNSRWSGYTVYGIGDLPLAGTDTEAEALEAKRAFELVLAPRFTRDEAIAIVKAAIEAHYRNGPDGWPEIAATARVVLEALAAAGVFSDDTRKVHYPTMADLLDAAGIR